MLSDSALRIAVALVLGIVLICAGFTGRLGSIIGAIVDPGDLVEG